MEKHQYFWSTFYFDWEPHCTHQSKEKASGVATRANKRRLASLITEIYIANRKIDNI